MLKVSAMEGKRSRLRGMSVEAVGHIAGLNKVSLKKWYFNKGLKEGVVGQVDIWRKNVPNKENSQECVLFKEHQGSQWKQDE